ncbi:hypothetical protein Syun_025533 [Stephania yunnanensis]|uniref:Pentatricopeptide repeat-containing protein n=1 Tax=Stephania yunnanensis TaxID=152371 RepID=A0AAP0HRC3_9MAGN
MWRTTPNVFDEMLERSIATCNAMVCGLAAHGHAKGALELFREMKREKVAPNYVTFVGVLSACCYAGWLKLVLMRQLVELVFLDGERMDGVVIEFFFSCLHFNGVSPPFN